LVGLLNIGFKLFKDWIKLVDPHLQHPEYGLELEEALILISGSTWVSRHVSYAWVGLHDAI
jgi:hypothetical protein